MRRCGDCQLCCKLLPVKDIGKGAHERCQHQRTGKGCAMYRDLWRIAPSCKLWSCQWLTHPEDTPDLSRPDRSHYVIDAAPDFVVADPGDGTPPVKIAVVQVWVDPDYRDAHRDPALRRYLNRLGAVGVAALIRYNAQDAFTLFPPSMTGGEWVENVGGRSLGRENTVEEVTEMLGSAGLRVEMRVRT